MKIKKIFKKWRVIILILLLLFSYMTISPNFGVEGVAIQSIETNSTAVFAGMQNPPPNQALTEQEIITAVNNKEISTVEEYANEISKIDINETVRIRTNRREYVLLKKEESLGITVKEAAKSNIRKGLDLQGGTRVLLQPEGKISDLERDDLIAIMENRLNVYGLSDITIKRADDLLGNKFIVIEVAGASKQEVSDLIESQGKFEAKIGNTTVFEGGKKDVTFVCRNDGTCAGIRECSPQTTGSFCRFAFTITLSSDAAKKHAEATKDLDVNITTAGQEVLSKTIDFYLDDNLVDSLQIDSSLRGTETTNIEISGPGFGIDDADASENALQQMNKLQTILITGSLPFELEIVKLDSISPVLGKAFVKNAFTVALLAILAVAVVIFIRYRRLKIVIPMGVTIISEIIIILGFASFFRYNLDLAAIAGIIATIGTGIDDQIVIIDEILGREAERFYRWKERIKRAFFIIMAAYATTLVAMLPLLRAGAGLLTGFALVTIVGISIGVFVTRPAFAAIMEVLVE